jgi:hypothetical protein
MAFVYFNLIGGLSGDMLISSLIDLGLDEKKLFSELKKIDDIDFTLITKKTHKFDLEATHTSVIIKDQIKWTWNKFYDVIKKSKLNQKIKNQTINCFDILKQAEESAHNEKNPHLHELGTSDTIVDVCGFFIGLNLLGVSEIYSSPIPVAPGFIQTSHGIHDTLAPATKKIVEEYNIPLRYINDSSNIETVTPTGLSILASIAKFKTHTAFTPEKFGMGAGTKDFDTFPNVLSVSIDYKKHSNFISTKKLLIETNVDDMSPEATGSIIDFAIDEGALDCWIINYNGKKNRPGNLINLLCETKDKDKFVKFILEHTTSLGLRVREIERYETEREFEEYNSSLGIVKIKFKYIDGKIHSFKVEHDDILKISYNTGLPVHKISNKLDYEINKKYDLFR